MKTKTLFACQACGFQSPKWLGRCPECADWNSFAEEVSIEKKSRRGDFRISGSSAGKVELLREVALSPELRAGSGIGELDHVLGGGIVQGSVVLIGGAPGIGKSTLLLQVCAALSNQGKKVVYVSAEESARQTKLRAERLGGIAGDLYILSETNLDCVLEQCRQMRPDVIVADSIQVLYVEEVSSAAGSVSQVRECAARLTMLAKQTGTAVFLVGHVTKEGAIAGPRVLEHLVDSVLYFEGEDQTNFRILRAVKNRFGSTNEIGIFEMTGNGLREVLNPSELFLTQRPQAASGSAVTATIEGTRPLLVEIQALSSLTNFGYPRRQSTGFDVNRAALLIAVLEKRAGLALQTQDIFLNVAGGVRIVEPAADLAVAAAITSSFRDRPLRAAQVIFGEIGLGGEIRAVPQAAKRIAEAAKLGFRRAVVPQANRLAADLPGGEGMEVVGAQTVGDALEFIF
ncbi:MAG: DNA repair protein RadA [Candidatus Omnitrophica bacterium]|nr:DNA repair protein RadA [Candidatus Omnitrophota bacterium]